MGACTVRAKLNSPVLITCPRNLNPPRLKQCPSMKAAFARVCASNVRTITVFFSLFWERETPLMISIP
jgi:hypothetical protein